MYGAHAHIKMGVFSLKITISQTIDIYQYFLNIILSSLLFFEKSEKVQIVSINKLALEASCDYFDSFTNATLMSVWIEFIEMKIM